jgi:formate dehydrogenase subunit gamma
MATRPRDLPTKGDHFINRHGLTIVYRGELLRHRAYTRFLLWAYGVCFFLALISGLGIYTPFLFRWFAPLFGGGANMRLLHPWFGLGFVFFFSLQALNWAALMRWTPGDTRWMKNLRNYITHQQEVEPPDVGFFNAGQKGQFWEIVFGCVAFVITGVIMWFPEIFGRVLVAISYVIHDISALVMLAGVFIHIYLSTIGEPGTSQAMTKGTVSEPWAWTHHPAWYKEVTGRDPSEALEEERKKMKDPEA